MAQHSAKQRTARDVQQQFCVSERLPYLTIRTTRDSTQAYKAHSHAEFSVGLMLSGATQLSLPQGELLLEQGDIILIAPQIVHACNPLADRSRSYHMLYIDNAWCCDVLSAHYEYPVRQFSCNINKVAATAGSKRFNALLAAFIHQNHDADALAIADYLRYLLCRYCTPQTINDVANPIVHALTQRLLQNISSAPPLQAMAQEFKQPQATLIRTFKKHYGITPKAFVNNQRVEQAKMLLKSGMSIVDVASEVGCADQSQLHRMFVNYTASTPRQYQQTLSIFDNKS
ncbi:AraC family transcriptional regulator [Shewanella sp. C32]|uniref:AraC family transcriptional regulator n=1 Tax=Shewanella electrica TaxID=515560 RepID=A0ABT2FJD1_9GAMM|nr:AraC family transcriptional regulator [Shewanella electrica]MCH1924198.1 AraC family transcriptional regulator [Shewanella electrica]MCS4556101.1 AraC family transcriptional regulator [Shewanella electrica]